MEFSAASLLEGQVLLLDKPLNWTSFDVVNKLRYTIRRSYNIKKIKVGHAGTLDPLATGLLIICTGRATKQINTYMGQEKEYTGTFALGATTPSYDLEAEVDQQFTISHIDDLALENARSKFLGNIQQLPPIFSAIKKGGEKAYDLARKGEMPEMQSREVHISEFEIGNLHGNEINFRVVCSKGTYIRSLAHDFGKALNSGAYLSSLRRTRIGELKVEDALTPSAMVEILESQSI